MSEKQTIMHDRGVAPSAPEPGTPRGFDTKCSSPDYSWIPAPASDPLARRGCSRSAFSTDCQYACVGLTCEQPRRTSVSNALRRHSWIIRAWISRAEVGKVRQ